MKLKGKKALVTGGSRGIGRAIALKLALEGTDVAINFVRHKNAADETARLIEEKGSKALSIRANVGKLEEIKPMFGEIEREFGGLDILISNAASGVLKPVMELDAKGWTWTHDINARALLLCAQEAARMMRQRGGGKIVSISSFGSARIIPNYAAMGVSKASIETLTRYLAFELGRENINVNAVSVGIVETDALKHFSNREEMIEQAKKRTPAGRLGTPMDIANVVAFLCSEEANWIQGQTIVVDGGYTLLA